MILQRRIERNYDEWRQDNKNQQINLKSLKLYYKEIVLPDLNNLKTQMQTAGKNADELNPFLKLDLKKFQENLNKSLPNINELVQALNQLIHTVNNTWEVLESQRQQNQDINSIKETKQQEEARKRVEEKQKQEKKEMEKKERKLSEKSPQEPSVAEDQDTKLGSTPFHYRFVNRNRADALDNQAKEYYDKKLPKKTDAIQIPTEKHDCWVGVKGKNMIPRIDIEQYHDTGNMPKFQRLRFQCGGSQKQGGKTYGGILLPCKHRITVETIIEAYNLWKNQDKAYMVLYVPKEVTESELKALDHKKG